MEFAYRIQISHGEDVFARQGDEESVQVFCIGIDLGQLCLRHHIDDLFLRGASRAAGANLNLAWLPANYANGVKADHGARLAYSPDGH